MWILHGVILQDMDAVPPVCPVEMVPQPASGVGLPWETWEVSLTIDSGLGEDDFIYLGEVLIFAYRKPVPVDLWLCYI